MPEQCTPYITVTNLHNFFSTRDQNSIYIAQVDAVTLMINGQLMAFKNAILGWYKQGPAIVKAENISGHQPKSMIALEKCLVLFANAAVIHSKGKQFAVKTLLRVFFPRTQPVYKISPCSEADFAHTRESMSAHIDRMSQEYGIAANFRSFKPNSVGIGLEPGKVYLMPYKEGLRLLRCKKSGKYVHAPYPVHTARTADYDFARNFVLEVPRPSADPLTQDAFVVCFLKYSSTAPVSLWRGEELATQAEIDWTPRLESCVSKIPFIHVVPCGESGSSSERQSDRSSSSSPAKSTASGMTRQRVASPAEPAAASPPQRLPSPVKPAKPSAAKEQWKPKPKRKAAKAQSESAENSNVFLMLDQTSLLQSQLGGPQPGSSEDEPSRAALGRSNFSRGKRLP